MEGQDSSEGQDSTVSGGQDFPTSEEEAEDDDEEEREEAEEDDLISLASSSSNSTFNPVTSNGTSDIFRHEEDWQVDRLVGRMGRLRLEERDVEEQGVMQGGGMQRDLMQQDVIQQGVMAQDVMSQDVVQGQDMSGVVSDVREGASIEEGRRRIRRAMEAGAVEYGRAGCGPLDV